MGPVLRVSGRPLVSDGWPTLQPDPGSDQWLWALLLIPLSCFRVSSLFQFSLEPSEVSL